MWKALGIGILIGVLIAGLSVWAVAGRYYSAEVTRISEQLDSSKRTNQDLTNDNTELRAKNSELGATVAGLREDIQREGIKHREELGRIKSTLGEVEADLGRAGSTLDDIIDGISSIIALVKAL